jgi:hypothetical protein
MASEDSDQVLSGFSMVHGLRDFRDLDQPLGRQVPAFMAHLDAPRKLLEILPLRRAKRVGSEERDDHSKEIVPPGHDVAVQVLLVIVVPSIDADGTDAKELLQPVQGINAFRALNDHKTVSYLVSGLVALSTSPIWLSNEANGEASLSVYKTNNPVRLNQPFLLIFRTVRIVTAHDHYCSLGRVPDGYTGFPAYSRMLTVTLL